MFNKLTLLIPGVLLLKIVTSQVIGPIRNAGTGIDVGGLDIGNIGGGSIGNIGGPIGNIGGPIGNIGGPIGNIGPIANIGGPAISGGFGGIPFGGGYGCGSSGLPVSGLAASRGGTFNVNSFSPIAPTGLSIYSENTLEGSIGVTGQLPFLGAVGFEGSLPNEGQSVIEYGCGNGEIGITNEEIPPQNPNQGFPGVNGLGGPFSNGFGF